MAAASPFARAVEVGGAATMSQQQHYAHHQQQQQQQQQQQHHLYQQQQQQPSLGGPLPSFGAAAGDRDDGDGSQANTASSLPGVFSGALMTDIARMHSTGLEGGVGAVLAVPPPPPPSNNQRRGSDLLGSSVGSAQAQAAPPTPPRCLRLRR